MRKGKSTDIVCILITGAAVVTMLLTSGRFGPPVDRRLHAEIGRTLAREALGLLRPGGQITIVTRDTEAFPQPALDILLKSFRREVRRVGDFPIVTKSLQLDPLRPVEVPPGDFYEVIRQSGDDRVIVSLLGPPALTREQRAALGRAKPKIIAFCSGNLAEALDLRELFNAGLLHVALVNRSTAPAAGPASAGGLSEFDRLYTVVRSDLAGTRVQGNGR
jgi:hypothetical protein